MGSSTVRSIFDKGTEAFNGHDAEAMMETWADDVVTRAPGGPALAGKEASRTFFTSWLDAFPDARVEFQDIHEAGQVVIGEGTFHGTHRATLRGPGGELPATGRTVQVGFIQVVRYRGDRVASFHLVFDRMELLEQLGLTPSPDAEHPQLADSVAPAPSMQ